jgi:hypothetical protein
VLQGAGGALRDPLLGHVPEALPQRLREGRLNLPGSLYRYEDDFLVIGLAAVVSKGWGPELLATALMVAHLKKISCLTRCRDPKPRADWTTSTKKPGSPPGGVFL